MTARSFLSEWQPTNHVSQSTNVHYRPAITLLRPSGSQSTCLHQSRHIARHVTAPVRHITRLWGGRHCTPSRPDEAASPGEPAAVPQPPQSYQLRCSVHCLLSTIRTDWPNWPICTGQQFIPPFKRQRCFYRDTVVCQTWQIQHSRRKTMLQ